MKKELNIWARTEMKQHMVVSLLGKITIWWLCYQTQHCVKHVEQLAFNFVSKSLKQSVNIMLHKKINTSIVLK